MKMMDVIMPCYIVNEELLQLTKSAVESLGSARIIVIDNGSPIGGGYLRSIAQTYVKNNSNLGYATAVNQGIKLIQSDYFAVANNDIIVSQNWQEVSFEVLSIPNTYSCHFKMINYEEPFSYGNLTVYTGKERWCTSSFFVIHSAQPLIYNEKFGIGGYEDYDYWHRVRKLGLKTAYTNKAIYKHKHSSTQLALDQKERAERDQKSRDYFKHLWGMYPDELYEKKYPEQWAQDYGQGFI